MVGFKASALVIAATAVGMAAADSAGWSLHRIDETVGITVAGPLGVVNAAAIVEGGIEDCVNFCAEYDNCIGFMYDEDYSATEGYCAALTYSLGGFTDINPGYEWIGWRFDAPTGPSCNSETDSIPNENGQCVCDAATEVQDTAFGCRVRAAASQVARRQRLARDTIMPGRERRFAF